MRKEKPQYTNSRVRPYFELVKGVLKQAKRDNRLDRRTLEVYQAYYWDLKDLLDMEDGHGKI